MKARLISIRGKSKSDNSILITEHNTVTIGRGKECTWVMSSKQISRIHCQVEIEGQNCWLEDLESANGTYVNGQQIQKVALRHKDIIRIGGISILFEICKGSSDQTWAKNKEVEFASKAKTNNSREEELVQDSQNQTNSLSPAAIKKSMSVKAGDYLGAFPKLFAHYRIEKELGRGGMGMVYKAYDTKLERTVALKVIALDHEIHEQQITRFLQEARATAQLDHPNIISIYEVGDTPQHYFTMEYLQGETLDHQKREGKLSPVKIATILLKVVQALEVVHKAGIIHRDIKPSNIMMVEGKPKLMDFGLAKVVDSNLSCPGTVVGTPAYMSPEQAQGKAVWLRSDIYSIGATLYELLTGRPLFQGDSHVNILYQILENDPITPCALNPDIPADLEAICLKCIEKNASKRYPSAKILVQDLQNFLENRPILAKPPTKITYIKKAIVRHRIVFAIAVLCLVMIFLATIFYIKLEGEKFRQIQSKLGESLAAQGDALINAKRWQDAKSRYLEAYNLFQKSGTSSLLADIGIWKLYRHSPPPINRFRAHDGWVRSVAFFPDGSKIITASADKTIKIWDATTGRHIRTLKGHQHWIGDVAVSADGRLICSASTDHTLKFWNAQTGKYLRTLRGHTGSVNSVAFSSNGSFVVSASADSTLKLWDVKKGKLLRSFSGHGNRILGTAFSYDDRYVVSASEDYTIKLWDSASGVCIRTFSGHQDQVNAVAFSPNDQFLVSASSDQSIKLWDVAKGKEVHTFSGHEKAVRSIAFSPDGNYFASASGDRSIRLWDLQNKSEIRSFIGIGKMYCVAFCPNGKLLVSGDSNNNIQLWDVASASQPYSLQQHAPIESIVFTKDGLIAIATGEEHTIKAWDLATGRCLQIFQGHQRRVTGLALSPDERRVVSGSNDQNIKVWDMVSGRPLLSMLDRDGSVTDIALSADGSLIASGNHIGMVKLWRFRDGAPQTTFANPHRAAVYSVAFSPNNKFVVAGCADALYVWNIATSKLALTLAKNSGGVYSVAVSPNNKWILSGGWNRILQLWDAKSGKQLRSFTGHSDAVTSVVFSSDSHLALSGSYDHSIKLWDIANGRELQTFEDHQDWVLSIAFSADSKQILSGGRDNSLKFWDFSRSPRYLQLEHQAETARQILRQQENPQALVTLGKWYAFRGIWGAALHCLQSARRHGAEGSSIVLARCYWQNGQSKKASREFRRGLLRREAPQQYLQLCLKAISSDNLTSHVSKRQSWKWIKKIPTDYIALSSRFTINGRYVLYGGREGRLTLYDLVSSKVVRTFRGHTDSIIDIAVAGNRPLVLTAGSDQTVRLWEIATGKQVHCFRGHGNHVIGVDFAPCGRKAISAGLDCHIKLWDLETYKLLHSFVAHRKGITGIAFSPNGHLLVSGSLDHTAKLWDLRARKLIHTLVGHTDVVWDVGFTPDGTRVYTSSWDKSIKLWSVQTGHQIRSFTSHHNQVWGAALSADGQHLISGDADGRVCLWEVATGRQIRSFKGHSEVVYSTAFSFDGTRAISTSRDKSIAIWETKLGD